MQKFFQKVATIQKIFQAENADISGNFQLIK